MAIQIQGVSGVVSEVETSHRAMRITQRPLDVGTLGSYSKSAISAGSTVNLATVMAAGLAVNSPIFSFRTGATNPFYIIRHVLLTAGSVAAFTAGSAIFNMFVCRSFTASDTGGAAGTLTGNNNKMRTSFGTMGIADFRISTTATLTPGTRTKDNDPIASIVAGIPATAGNPFVFNQDLYHMDQGERGLELVTNEGFVIEASVPATGTWQFAVTVEWDEPPATVWS